MRCKRLCISVSRTRVNVTGNTISAQQPHCVQHSLNNIPISHKKFLIIPQLAYTTWRPSVVITTDNVAWGTLYWHDAVHFDINVSTLNTNVVPPPRWQFCSEDKGSRLLRKLDMCLPDNKVSSSNLDNKYKFKNNIFFSYWFFTVCLTCYFIDLTNEAAVFFMNYKS